VLPIAALPNPADASVIALGATIGGFRGRALARRKGADRDAQTHAAIAGSYNGTAVALFVYIVANGIALLGS